MSAPRHRHVLGYLAVALSAGLGAALAASPAAAEPELRVRDNGRMVARWDDGCRVRYDARGRRDSADGGCSDRQVSRSDERVRRELAQGGGSGEMADPTFETQAGRTEATYPNGCRIEYDRNGRRRDSNRACTRAQVSRADRQATRRLGSADGGGGELGDPTFENRNGLTEAVYPNGCRVFYDEVGRRTDSNKRCQPAQVQKADRQLQRIWAREDGRGRSISKPYVVASNNRNLQARFTDGCNVNYTQGGDFTGMSDDCTDAHRRRADRELASILR
ncbi:MAG: hypothetical protein AAGI51_01920 [Pseudomonadota bacterium]